MFGLSVLLAAFAMAGAPAVPTVCNPAMTGGEQGRTSWATTPADPSTASINLGPNACAALLLLAASPQDRQDIARLNPGRNLQVLESSILVVLHEASHVALQTTDETAVECRAMSLTPDFLARYLSGDELTNALSFAKQSDALLPGSYRAHPCVQAK